MARGWSREDFARRVQARADEIGKSLAQVGKDAGMSVDVLRKGPESPLFSTVVKVAEALDTTLVDLLGLEGRLVVNREALRLSIVVAERFTRRERDRANRMARIASAIYQPILDTADPDGRFPEDQAVIRMAEGFVKALLGEFGSP